MKILILFIIAIVIIAIFAYFSMIMPGRSSKEKKSDFSGLYFAHRGLHNAEKGIPENTMAAFRAAVEKGYAIELDVRLTADDMLVVFHDDDLMRLTGKKGTVESKKYKELKEYTVGGTQEHIPLLVEVLDMVGGRVPVMVDLMNGNRNQDLCVRSSGMLKAYPGKVCVGSFHPGIISWYKRNAPEIFRGLIVCQQKKYNANIPKRVSYMKSHMLTNKVSRPQFIAYRNGSLPLAARFCYAAGALRIGWTCRKPGSEGKNSSVLFEGYEPPVKLSGK
ncbi:MAG: glycerophosphodiester phosphodiesterase [Oscillospiraceae bacterium]|nr:glycerophosphodiester phosphodiesterase [Oscillospiraceae bacterium]